MLLGLSAEAAIRHAITHCQNIGGAVQVERVCAQQMTIQQYWARFRAGRPITKTFETRNGSGWMDH